MTECQHNDCGGMLVSTGEDPALPEHITKFECEVCGEWYDHDEESGSWEIDA